NRARQGSGSLRKGQCPPMGTRTSIPNASRCGALATEQGATIERGAAIRGAASPVESPDMPMAARCRQGINSLYKMVGARRPRSIAPEAPMRIILVATAAAAAMSLDPRASQAYEMPWCALTEIGGGAMYENCTLPTFEMCVQEVIAGNRGFCIP